MQITIFVNVAPYFCINWFVTSAFKSFLTPFFFKYSVSFLLTLSYSFLFVDNSINLSFFFKLVLKNDESTTLFYKKGPLREK